MARPRRLRSTLVSLALLVASGALLLSSCAGGAVPPVSMFLLVGVVALGGWLSGCSGALARPDAATGGTGGTDAAPATDVPRATCLTDSQFDQSLPSAPDASGWSRCCLQHQTRYCPPVPQAACNYGLGTTFNSDGSCGYGISDGGADLPLDLPGDATDAVADTTGDTMSVDDDPCARNCYLLDGCFSSSMPRSGEIAAGWTPCCLQQQQRLCLGNPPQCNYALNNTVCADGTCRTMGTACPGPDAAADGNVTAP